MKEMVPEPSNCPKFLRPEGEAAVRELCESLESTRRLLAERAGQTQLETTGLEPLPQDRRSLAFVQAVLKHNFSPSNIEDAITALKDFQFEVESCQQTTELAFQQVWRVYEIINSRTLQRRSSVSSSTISTISTMIPDWSTGPQVITSFRKEVVEWLKGQDVASKSNSGARNATTQTGDIAQPSTSAEAYTSTAVSRAMSMALDREIPRTARDRIRNIFGLTRAKQDSKKIEPFRGETTTMSFSPYIPPEGTLVIRVAEPQRKMAAWAESERRDEDALMADDVVDVEETSEGRGARAKEDEGAKVQGYKGHDAIPDDAYFGPTDGDYLGWLPNTTPFIGVHNRVRKESTYQVESEARSGGETRATLQEQSPTNILVNSREEIVGRKTTRLSPWQASPRPPIPRNPSWQPGALPPVRYTATQLGSHLNPQYPVGTQSTSQLWSTEPSPAVVAVSEVPSDRQTLLSERSQPTQAVLSKKPLPPLPLMIPLRPRTNIPKRSVFIEHDIGYSGERNYDDYSERSNHHSEGKDTLPPPGPHRLHPYHTRSRTERQSAPPHQVPRAVPPLAVGAFNAAAGIEFPTVSGPPSSEPPQSPVRHVPPPDPPPLHVHYPTMERAKIDSLRSRNSVMRVDIGAANAYTAGADNEEFMTPIQPSEKALGKLRAPPDAELDEGHFSKSLEHSFV